MILRGSDISRVSKKKKKWQRKSVPGSRNGIEEEMQQGWNTEAV
jgi:hypothetical protein